MNTNLVKFSCGCIGFNFRHKALVVAPCDGDLSDKTSEPMDEEASRKLLDEVAALVHDGHKFRDVKRILVSG